MFDELMRLFKTGSGQAPKATQQDLRVAATALLVHAAFIDGSFAESEEQRLRHLLAAHFSIGPQEVEDLIRAGAKAESEAVDLYGFTRVLTGQLDQEERKEIVSMLWAMVLADGQVHSYESVLVERVCDLLGVAARDRVWLRTQVASGAWKPGPGAPSNDPSGN